MQDTLTNMKKDKIEQLLRDRIKLFNIYIKDINRIEKDYKEKKTSKDTHDQLRSYKTEIYRQKTTLIDKQIKTIKDNKETQ